MDKRNKLWRRQQMARVFKARMILYAAYGHPIIHEDGSVVEHPHWFELAKDKWAKVYQSTGTPCSCWMCRGEEYNRRQYIINLRELHAVVGCAEGKSITVDSTKRKLCALFESQLNRNRESHSLRI